MTIINEISTKFFGKVIIKQYDNGNIAWHTEKHGRYTQDIPAKNIIHAYDTIIDAVRYLLEGDRLTENCVNDLLNVIHTARNNKKEISRAA